MEESTLQLAKQLASQSISATAGGEDGADAATGEARDGSPLPLRRNLAAEKLEGKLQGFR